MANILFIFEGEVTEHKYYQVIDRALSAKGKKPSNINFYPYKTNIYVLYEELKNDGSLNVIELIKERARKVNDFDNYQMLSNTKFGEIYLVFDLDPQDERYDENKIEDMINLFDNETEHGKLYINYPMIESFKHFKSIPDPQYNSYKVKVSDCLTYKQDVSCITCIEDYRKINPNQYFSILNQNLAKANYLINKLNTSNYDTYRNTLTQGSIFALQKNEINKNSEVYIVNSFCFWPLDYFDESFFNSVVK